MIDSQFEALRQKLRALRGDIDGRFDAAQTRLTKREASLETKPDKAFAFQTILTGSAGFVAVIGLTILNSRSFLIA